MPSQPLCPLVSKLALVLAIGAATPTAARADAPWLHTTTASGIEVSLPWYFQAQWLRADADRTPIPDRFGFRRMRIALEVELPDHWAFKSEYDVESEQWTDVNLDLALPVGVLRLGQYKMPLGLEETGSNRDELLLEGSLANSLALARRLGAGWEWADARSSLRAAAFTRDLSRSDNGQGVAVRATWLPWLTEQGLVHLGSAVSFENPDAGQVRFNSRPEAGLARLRIVDTGMIDGVDGTWRASLEAGMLYGPWSAQAEIIHATLKRAAGDLSFYGASGQVAWVLTGESRRYQRGLFRRVQPEGRLGALELAARYSTLDLDDREVGGGEVRNLTLGVNWFITRDLRWSANWVDVRSERAGVADDPQLLEVRVLAQF